MLDASFIIWKHSTPVRLIAEIAGFLLRARAPDLELVRSRLLGCLILDERRHRNMRVRNFDNSPLPNFFHIVDVDLQTRLDERPHLIEFLLRK